MVAPAVARFRLYLGAPGRVGLVPGHIVSGRETGGMHGAVACLLAAAAANRLRFVSAMRARATGTGRRP